MFCNRACRTAYRQQHATALYKEVSLNGERIYEHRLVAALKIGRPLRSDEHVHHIDGDGWNNDPENLEVLDRKAHRARHRSAPLWCSKAVMLAEDGKTIREIATQLNMPYRRVWRALQSRGVRWRRDNVRPTRVDLPIAARLFAEGLSLREIGRRMGFSHPTIGRVLQRLR